MSTNYKICERISTMMYSIKGAMATMMRIVPIPIDLLVLISSTLKGYLIRFLGWHRSPRAKSAAETSGQDLGNRHQ